MLRDVNDCESISGHMYRMSILTFLLDGSEGLDQIRCMELALVHDLAESLVGDITPFCGVSKNEKRAMELKAMQDICKLIEPRGRRIMELFEVIGIIYIYMRFCICFYDSIFLSFFLFLRNMNWAKAQNQDLSKIWIV